MFQKIIHIALIVGLFSISFVDVNAQSGVNLSRTITDGGGTGCTFTPAYYSTGDSFTVYCTDSDNSQIWMEKWISYRWTSSSDDWYVWVNSYYLYAYGKKDYPDSPYSWAGGRSQFTFDNPKIAGMEIDSQAYAAPKVDGRPNPDVDNFNGGSYQVSGLGDSDEPYAKITVFAKANYGTGESNAQFFYEADEK